MNPYINFLNLLSAISLLEKFPSMTPLSKLILDQVARHEASGKPLTVRQLIGHQEIASPATLHKHLARLRDSGYITTQTDDLDKRTKYLLLSSIGQEYIQKLSKAIVKAANS
jgi:DNA-binding MarR family transcriptional regulator